VRTQRELGSAVNMDAFAFRRSKVASIYTTPLHDPAATSMDGLLLMMMIAFITFKSSLVPLLEGL